MKENEKKQQQISGQLRSVDRSTEQIQETRDSTAVEIQNPSLSEIVNQLKSGICTLFFYKMTDGTMRRMRCTLQGASPVENKCNRQGVVVVWDLDASQWRSFYPNRVFRLIRNEKTDIQ